MEQSELSVPETPPVTTVAEIEGLLRKVTEGRAEIAEKQKDGERLKEAFSTIKEGKRKSITQLQTEIAEIDSEEASTLSQLSTDEQSIERNIHDAREFLLRRVTLCNVKNALSKGGLAMTSQPREIYRNVFLSIYEAIGESDKPVNKVSYRIRVNIVRAPELVYQLKELCKPLKDMWWDVYGEAWSATYFDRDFKTNDDAEKYGERNRAKVSEDLLSAVKYLEKEIVSSTPNVDDVFDFRLITSTTASKNYSDSMNFKVISTEKHKLVVSPVRSQWDNEETKSYNITVTQRGYDLEVEGHKHEREREELIDFTKRYFHFIKEVSS